MISKRPVFTEERSFVKEEKDIETIKGAVRGIRNIRSEMNVAPSRKAGVYVVSVDGPAKERGLLKGDVITAIDGVRVENILELRIALLQHNVGDKIEISFLRNNISQKVKITLSSK